MIEALKKIETTKSNLRRFGIMLGIILLAPAPFLYWNGNDAGFYLFCAGLPFLITGAVIPRCLKQIYVGWMTVSILLGWIFTNLILSLVFFLGITPIRVLLQLTGKIPLSLKPEPGQETYWNNRESSPQEIGNYEKQF